MVTARTLRKILVTNILIVAPTSSPSAHQGEFHLSDTPVWQLLTLAILVAGIYEAAEKQRTSK